MSKWIRSHHILFLGIIIGILSISLLIVPATTMGVTWVTQVGLLPGNSVVFATNSASMDRFMARALETIYGDRIAVCDGTSDQTEINTAITASSSGVVRLWTGTYTVSSSIQMNTDNVILQGSGWSTVITTTSNIGANTGIIEITDNQCMVSDLSVDGNKNVVANGCGVHVDGAIRTQLIHLLLINAKERNLLIDGASYWTIIDRCISRYSYSDSVVVSASNETQFTNTLIGWVDNATYTAEDALILSNAQNTLVSNCWFDSSRYLLSIYNSNSCRIVSSNFELAQRHGLYLDGSSSGNIIDSCTIRDNSKEATLTYCGIRIASTASNNIITNCSIFNDGVYDSLYGTNRQQYGIYIGATCDSNVIKDNQFDHALGNGTGAIYDTGIHSRIQGNKGFMAPGEIRTTYGSLTAGVTNAIGFYWHNPESNDIRIAKVVVTVSTKGGTMDSVLDVGIADDAAGTNRGTEFFNDVALNNTGTHDSWLLGDNGTQTTYVACQDNASATDGWVVGQILAANASSLVGKYYIEYVDGSSSITSDTQIAIVDDIPTTTVTVAASDAIASEKMQAQWVCDGTADDVEIQAALDYLSSGGTLRLSGGNFSISSPIIIDTSYTQLIGQGFDTTLTPVNSFNDTVIAFDNSTERYCCILRDFSISGNKAGQATGIGINATAANQSLFENIKLYQLKTYGLYANSLSVDTFANTARNLIISQSDGDCIRMEYCYDWVIDGCHATTSSGYGMYLNSCGELVITNNAVYMNTSRGIYLYSGRSILIDGNPYIGDNGLSGLEIAGTSGRDILVSNNEFLENGAADGAGTHENGVYVVAGENITITGNRCYDYDDSGADNDQDYGIYVESTNPKHVFIYGNNVRGNIIQGIYDEGGVDIQIHDNMGYIAPGEIKYVSGSLTAGHNGDYAFAWQNPETEDILIIGGSIHVVTPSGLASTLDIGTAADATTHGTDILEDMDASVADTIWEYSGIGQVDAQDGATDWVTCQILDADALALVGTYYIIYQGA